MHDRTLRTLLLLGALVVESAPAGATDLSGQVVLPPGRNVEDAVVYVTAIAGRSYPAPAQPQSLDQRQLRFSPHVLVVQRGQKVLFPNTDIIRHNVFSPSRGHRFNLGIFPPGNQKEMTFDKAGVVPVLCNVHSDMNAFIVVVDTPFHARPGADGRFLIKDVPPGRHEVVVWAEGLPEARQPLDFTGPTRQLSVTLRRSD